MTHRIIDISSNNPHPIDFHAVKASGVDAVFVKATEGTGYANPDYASDIAAAEAAGLLTAAYHFGKHTDPTAEAHFFHQVAGVRAKILDFETQTDVAWADSFLSALGQVAAQEMTYGSASTLPNNIDRGLLWPAAYGASPGRGECWQYTSSASVPGVQGLVDESVWTGSEGQWVAFFGLTAVAPSGGGGVSVVDMAPTPSGKGYWEIGGDGGVFSYGDAVFHGSLGGKGITNIVGIAARPQGDGYWLVGSDGGVFSFGSAPFKGSLGGIKLASPIISISCTPTGLGYWLVAKDGIFSFGDAPYEGHA